jgi:hypothetical protein
MAAVQESEPVESIDEALEGLGRKAAAEALLRVLAHLFEADETVELARDEVFDLSELEEAPRAGVPATANGAGARAAGTQVAGSHWGDRSTPRGLSELPAPCRSPAESALNRAVEIDAGADSGNASRKTM